MNKKLFMPFLALSALILIVGCIRVTSGEDNWMCVKGSWVKHGMPSAKMPTIPCNNANIKVTNLKLNQEVTLPFTVSGEAMVFENQLNYKIIDSQGVIIKNGNVMTKSEDVGKVGTFEIKITTLSTMDTKVTLEVFDLSAKDGSEIDMVIVPLQLKTT